MRSFRSASSRRAISARDAVEVIRRSLCGLDQRAEQPPVECTGATSALSSAHPVSKHAEAGVRVDAEICAARERAGALRSANGESAGLGYFQQRRLTRSGHPTLPLWNAPNSDAPLSAGCRITPAERTSVPGSRPIGHEGAPLPVSGSPPRFPRLGSGCSGPRAPGARAPAVVLPHFEVAIVERVAAPRRPKGAAGVSSNRASTAYSFFVDAELRVRRAESVPGRPHERKHGSRWFFGIRGGRDTARER